LDQQTVRKTFKEQLRPTKEQLRPTPAQERALDEVLWRCREHYNAALEQRITAWQRRRVSVSRYAQEAELKAIRAEMSENPPGFSPCRVVDTSAYCTRTAHERSIL
jgi:putative transposase